MLTISTSPAVGMVDGYGYDGRQKDAICDICGPCLTIRSTFKPVCCWFQLIGYTYELLRCLDVEIWQFRGDNRWTDGQTDWLLYLICACARVNKAKRRPCQFNFLFNVPNQSWLYLTLLTYCLLYFGLILHVNWLIDCLPVYRNQNWTNDKCAWFRTRSQVGMA